MLGVMINRRNKELTDTDRQKIVSAYHQLAEQLSKGHTLETEIRENLKSIGYEF